MAPDGSRFPAVDTSGAIFLIESGTSAVATEDGPFKYADGTEAYRLRLTTGHYRGRHIINGRLGIQLLRQSGCESDALKRMGWKIID